MKCLLVGNYGAGNLGDDALREYFLTRFPEIEWTVLSAAPEGPQDVPRLPAGFRSFRMPWWKTLGALRRADAVIFGGGTLFTDIESVGACLLWWWHGFVARLWRKPLLLAFQGIGPLRTGVGEWCTRQTLARAAFLSVRDEESLRRIAGWATPAPVLSFDPVFSMRGETASVPSTERILTIIPRMNSGPIFRAAVEAALGREQPSAVRIISMQPTSIEEQQYCRSLLELVRVPSSIHAVRSAEKLIQSLGGSSLLVTERYHGALAGLALGIRTEITAQQRDDKLDALATFMKRSDARDEAQRRVETGERELRKFIDMVK